MSFIPKIAQGRSYVTHKLELNYLNKCAQHVV